MHEMVVRPVTCESIVVSMPFDTIQRPEEKCVNTQIFFDSRSLRFLVKNNTKQQENVNYADFLKVKVKCTIYSLANHSSKSQKYFRHRE